MASQLFVIDPIARLNPAKDSSVALIQAAQRAGEQVWVCTTADLAAADGPGGHGAWAVAQPLEPQPNGAASWYGLGDSQLMPLTAFPHVWMRKDPPVDEAYLYATHLLDLAERQGGAGAQPASFAAGLERKAQFLALEPANGTDPGG